MRQVNIVGTSPPSQPSRKIQTLQAPPDMAPANVTLRTASETSLWLRWMVRLPWGQWDGLFIGLSPQDCCNVVTSKRSLIEYLQVFLFTLGFGKEGAAVMVWFVLSDIFKFLPY